MSDELLSNEQIEPSSTLPINTTVSDPSNIPLEASESPKNADIPVSLNNDNPEDGPILTQNTEEPKPAESDSVEAENPKIEPVSEPVQTSENGTAQIPPNEPLKSENEPLSEPAQTETPEPQTEKAEATPTPAMQTSRSRVLELLNKAKFAIQFRKRKKLDRVMSLFLKQSKITNDEVEKFLHVSDATAGKIFKYFGKRK